MNYSPSPRFQAVLFDMDGTLLDTLSDMQDAVNHILLENGWPQRTLEEIRAFVGNGAAKLMERSIPEPLAPQRFHEILSAYKDWYQAHNCVKTAPYPGIPEVLAELEKMGVKTAVVSNKPDATTKALAEKFFPGMPALGQRDGVDPKPSPALVAQALSALGVRPENAVYVGDSEVDLETARNAGLPCFSVDWGNRSDEILLQYGAVSISHTAQENLKLPARNTSRTPPRSCWKCCADSAVR